MRNSRPASFGDFRCINCRAIVSSSHSFSATNNRNHCPYCLWSRHLDLYSAGDRLSACKAGMKPIGLTVKKSKNKYQTGPCGELMLVHACVECDDISINRIAADDDLEMLLTVFRSSLNPDHCNLYDLHDIEILGPENTETVSIQLHGQGMETPGR